MRRSCCCCTAFPARATCSGTSSRSWPTAFTSSPPTCRASAALRSCRAVRLHVRQDRRSRWTASPRSSASTDIALYVFDYGAPTGFRLAVQASGTDHRDHLPERQRLRGGAERRLESDPCVLAGAVAGQPGGPARLPDAGGDALAVHPRRARRDRGLPGRLFARQLLPGAAGRRRDPARPVPRLREQRGALPGLPGLLPRSTGRGFLAVWGKNDPFFLPAGAEAFKRDIPEADVRFFETGHFALETHAEPIAAAIREFLSG